MFYFSLLCLLFIAVSALYLMADCDRMLDRLGWLALSCTCCFIIGYALAGRPFQPL